MVGAVGETAEIGTSEDVAPLQGCGYGVDVCLRPRRGGGYLHAQVFAVETVNAVQSAVLCAHAPDQLPCGDAVYRGAVASAREEGIRDVGRSHRHELAVQDADGVRQRGAPYLDARKAGLSRVDAPVALSVHDPDKAGTAVYAHRKIVADGFDGFHAHAGRDEEVLLRDVLVLSLGDDRDRKIPRLVDDDERVHARYVAYVGIRVRPRLLGEHAPPVGKHDGKLGGVYLRLRRRIVAIDVRKIGRRGVESVAAEQREREYRQKRRGYDDECFLLHSRSLK